LAVVGEEGACRGQCTSFPPTSDFGASALIGRGVSTFVGEVGYTGDFP